MTKTSVGVAIIIIVVIMGILLLSNQGTSNDEFVIPSQNTFDARNSSFIIDGRAVTLADGISEIAISSTSAAKITTRYFGNELKTDLDGDSREDVAFVVTENQGGSGTFYYAVAVLNTVSGYVSSDVYLLGDRIAPQSTNLSPNPRHKNVVVFNYADRATGEPMTAAPSVGKSVYLKIDPGTMRWGIVEPDFEGESR